MLRLRAIAPALTIFLAMIWLAACAVPITPGYSIEKESRQIEFTPGQVPELRVEADYTLVNSGASDLTFIDITLPDAAAYGLIGLHAQVDGRDTPLQELPPEQQSDAPNAKRLPFSSPWKTKQSHQLSIEYVFRSPVQTGSTITLGPNEFHLGSRGAFAGLQPPKHLLAPFPKRPKKMFYTVRVPSDFRVLARGKPSGRKQSGDQTEYRYELRSDDLAMYVVGGRYVESAPQGSSGAIFWTFQPTTIDPTSAEAVAAAWNALQKDFGPLDRNIRAPHIVEAENLPAHISGEQGVAAVAFPGGALVSSAAFATEAPSDEFVEAVSHALAHNWFGDQMYPVAYARLALGEGLPEYAMIAIDEDLGGAAARRQRITRYLLAYDDATRQGDEQTLAVSKLSDPPAGRRIALAKAPLFFVALEDECGPGAMRKGLSQMVTLLRGQQVDYNALRSSLEETSGKDLAPLFRLWLNEKGIPADFRVRYTGNVNSLLLDGGIRQLQFQEAE